MREIHDTEGIEIRNKVFTILFISFYITIKQIAEVTNSSAKIKMHTSAEGGLIDWIGNYAVRP